MRFFLVDKSKEGDGREGATAKGERATERQHNLPREEFWATESGIDPGTLTLGHVIHGQ
jgi:hypothetical protein